MPPDPLGDMTQSQEPLPSLTRASDGQQKEKQAMKGMGWVQSKRESSSQGENNRLSGKDQFLQTLIRQLLVPDDKG